MEYGNGYWNMENIDRHSLNAVTLTFDTLTHLAVKDLFVLLETDIPTVLTVLNRMEMRTAERNGFAFVLSVPCINKTYITAHCVFPPLEATFQQVMGPQVLII